MLRSPLLTVLLIVAASMMSGCTSIQQSFPGQPSTNVWKAMVGVARTPDYRDPDVHRRWSIRENAVWVDEEAGRIEVYRRLAREVHQPRKGPRDERRTWRFRIELDPTVEKPTAIFTCRDWAIPSRVRAEAERYFDDVAEMLHAPIAIVGDSDAPE